MALDPQKQKKEIQQLNNEIKELYSLLGRTDLPPVFKVEEINKANDAVIGLKSQLGNIEDSLNFIQSSFRDSINALSKQNTELGKVRSSMGSISKIATQIKIENEDISNIDLKRIDSLEKRARLQFESLQIAKDSGSLTEEAEKEADFALSREQELLGVISKIKEEQSQILKNKGVKIFSGLDDITKTIPGLGKFTSMFQDAAKASKEQAAQNLKTFGTTKNLSKSEQAALNTKLKTYKELRDSGESIQSAMKKAGVNAKQVKLGKLPGKSAMSPLMAGIKSIGPALKKALGPLALITELVSAFFKVNKETVELQKGMALTASEAANFRANLSTAAKQSGDINVTASKLLESFSSLNKQFGFITNFATSTLVTMTKLTKVVGTSAESAGNLAAASSLSGKSFEANYKDVLGTSYELQRQSGVQMDLRDILEQTGKVTGTVRANLGANPAQIAKAITQAKIFGATLEQVASAGESLLNFESSIESELQAELLIGRDINLERARQAALMGDQVTLAKELQQQAGSYSDFQNMNVIQQQALAQAMGMTSDQMADILFQQEIQGKNAKELRALGKDELADRLEAQTVQDKFNNSVEKLKEIFADVATALMPAFEALGDIFSLIGKIIKMVEPVIGTITGALMGLAVGGPVGALIGGAIGGISDINRKTSTADDAIIPAGYGDTIIKKGKDTIALNNNDTVVAGTNLGQNTNNNQGTERALDKTNMLLEQILTKQGTVKMDATEVGTAFSVNTYNVQ